MEALELQAETACPRNWQCMVPQGVAFVVTFIQALVHAIPSCMLVFGSMFVLMGLDSIGLSHDVVIERRKWLGAWLVMACFGTILWSGVLVTAPGIVLGLIWLRGRENEAQKQARRVARLSLPLVIPSSIAAILFFAVAVCIQNWQLLLPAAWFALMAACSLSLFSHACLHFPPAAVDARGMLLTAVLLFGSVYQFWVSFILSGQSYSEDLGPNLASEILNVIQQLFIAAFWFIACITGAVGAAIAVRTFFSNKQRPDMQQLHTLERLHKWLLVGSVPVPVVLNSLQFLLTPSLGLASFRNCWSILEQPLVCALIICSLVEVNRMLRRAWSDDQQLENAQKTAVEAVPSDESTALIDSSSSVGMV